MGFVLPHVQDPRVHPGPGRGAPDENLHPQVHRRPLWGPLEDYRACRDKLVQQLEVFYESYVTRLLVFDNTMPPPPPFPEGSRPRP